MGGPGPALLRQPKPEESPAAVRGEGKPLGLANSCRAQKSIWAHLRLTIGPEGRIQFGPTGCPVRVHAKRILEGAGRAVAAMPTCGIVPARARVTGGPRPGVQ